MQPIQDKANIWMAGNQANGSTHTHTSLVALLMLGGVQSALAGQCASTAARDTRVGPRLDRQGTQLPHPCYHSNTLHNLFYRSSSLFQLSNECVHHNLYPSLCMFEAGSKSLPCFQQSKPTLPASLGYCLLCNQSQICQDSWSTNAFHSLFFFKGSSF